MRFNLCITIFIVSLIISCNMNTNKNYPETLTADKLLSIKLGMSKNSVKSILGEPIYENKDKFEYTKRLNYHYPMIWIHFDSSGVREVYVKEYHFLDDQGIYGISRDKSTGQIYQWGEKAIQETIK